MALPETVQPATEKGNSTYRKWQKNKEVPVVKESRVKDKLKQSKGKAQNVRVLAKGTS